MVINLQWRKRKDIRLKSYDYSQRGAYFITICIKDRHNLLWEPVGATCGRPLISGNQDNLPLSEIGKIVGLEINKIESYYNNVLIDKYVIMPNHLHIIIILNNTENVHTENGRPQVAPTISRIVQQFKGSISKQIGFSIWQKSFHDHIIRDEKEYFKIWEYIGENPLNWQKDCYYKSSNKESARPYE